MIKGCNKRVIVMKETGNAMIEEAFFILKPEAAKTGVTEGDIIKQANYILEKSLASDKLHGLSHHAKVKNRQTLPAFFSGAVIGVIITAGLFLAL